MGRSPLNARDLIRRASGAAAGGAGVGLLVTAQRVQDRCCSDTVGASRTRILIIATPVAVRIQAVGPVLTRVAASCSTDGVESLTEALFGLTVRA